MSNAIKTAEHCISLAAAHAGKGIMSSSAHACLRDAKRFCAEGRLDLVSRWCARSLAYSVGVFHADYQEVRALIPADVLRHRGV